MVDREPIRQRWETFGSKLDERGRRLFAAAEVRTAGRGGLAAVAEITGLARSTIGRGLKDLSVPTLADGRVRRKGGGRNELAEVDATLVPDLRRLVEPVTMGDPMRPLKWVSKSPAKLAAALRKSGHEVSPNTVSKLLETKLEYSRQVNRKTHEGASHPDRNAQFEHINAKIIAAEAAGQPVVSVDTKKKELIGNYKNAGSDYRPKGSPPTSRSMTSRTRRWARSRPTGFTTWPPMRAGSVSALPATQPSLRLPRSGPGSSAWGVSAIRACAS